MESSSTVGGMLLAFESFLTWLGLAASRLAFAARFVAGGRILEFPLEGIGADAVVVGC